jgi:hypothetical protein
MESVKLCLGAELSSGPLKTLECALMTKRAPFVPGRQSLVRHCCWLSCICGKLAGVGGRDASTLTVSCCGVVWALLILYARHRLAKRPCTFSGGGMWASYQVLKFANEDAQLA